MILISIFNEAFWGSLSSVVKMAAIIIPLMIIFEFVRQYKLLDYLVIPIKPVLRLLKLPKTAAMPLIAGLFFGISYGAGVIIEASKSGDLSEKELYLISLFLVICHSIFEDTLLFVSLGANGLIIVIFRLLFAVTVTYVLANWKNGHFAQKLAGQKKSITSHNSNNNCC